MIPSNVTQTTGSLPPAPSIPTQQQQSQPMPGYTQSTMQSVPGTNMVQIDAATLQQLLAAATVGAQVQQSKRINFPNGDVYEGQVNSQGKPHGKGTLTYSPSNQEERIKYVGEFQDGALTGTGAVYWKDGDIGEGQFVNGKQHGPGTRQSVDGTYCQGIFIDNAMTGKGVIKLPDGTVYTGMIVDGQAHGKGEKKTDKFTYVGWFNKGSFWHGNANHIVAGGLHYLNGQQVKGVSDVSVDDQGKPTVTRRPSNGLCEVQ
ncbi:MAG: hypothetical protein JSR58_00840 [Verrucomicrobia bacterium]|nr:hypothetical protein [Verrucomicrobiota bacterium]